MTTTFNTKEDALKTGAHYAGINEVDPFNGLTPEKRVMKFPVVKEIDVYTIKNVNGVDVGIGVGKFRDGFDLWLISLDSGMAHRV